MDENMLTGEAVPVRKVSYSPAVDGPNYNPDVHKSCTLYGGTTVAQVGARGRRPTEAAWARSRSGHACKRCRSYQPAAYARCR